MTLKGVPSKSVFCSKSCTNRSRHRRNREGLSLCQECGKEFPKKPGSGNKRNNIYCSDDCKYNAVCKVCGVRYRKTWRDQQTCSYECGAYSRRRLEPKEPRNHAREKLKFVRHHYPNGIECVVCHLSFEPTYDQARHWLKGGDKPPVCPKTVNPDCQPEHEAWLRARKRIAKLREGGYKEYRQDFSLWGVLIK